MVRNPLPQVVDGLDELCDALPEAMLPVFAFSWELTKGESHVVLSLHDDVVFADVYAREETLAASRC